MEASKPKPMLKIQIGSKPGEAEQESPENEALEIEEIKQAYDSLINGDTKGAEAVLKKLLEQHGQPEPEQSAPSESGGSFKDMAMAAMKEKGQL